MSRKSPKHPVFDHISDALGQVASELGGHHFSSFCSPTAWRPNLNAYRCGKSIKICVDLAGVKKESIKLTVHGQRLVLRGHRSTPEPPDTGSENCDRVLVMEIENGAFERALELPDAVDADAIEAKQEEGLLWIHLPLK